jgi:uncharacterized protein YodC (DUF2158 family)
MSAAKFKEGDVVSRITGGLLMTVEDVRTDHLVATVWFDGHGILHRDCFHPETLQKWVRSDD